MSPDVTYFPTMASFYFQDAPTFPIVDGSPSMPNMDFQTAVASILYQFQEIGADGSVVNSFMLNATDYSTVSSSGELDTTTGVYSSGQSTGTIKITGIISSTAGIVSVGGTPITPKSTLTAVEYSQPRQSYKARRAGCDTIFRLLLHC